MYKDTIFQDITIDLVSVCHLFAAVVGSLYGVGCEEGWLNHGHFCYSFWVNETSYEQAWLSCEELGSDLASVWTQEERTFITDTLWQVGSSEGKLYSNIYSRLQREQL